MIHSIIENYACENINKKGAWNGEIEAAKMWILTDNSKLPDVTHYLLCGEEIQVSRRIGHIVIQDDNSISRKHASFHISHNISNLKHPNVLPTVTLKELGAKYGTFVNSGIEENKKLPDRSEVSLSNGDKIRFGMLWNTWKISYIPMVCTMSALDSEAKKVVSKAVERLGGHLLSDWTDACTLLIMKSITLTVKVVCALAAGCYIVTPEYFEKLIKAVEEKIEHPEPKDYEPPLEEKSLRKNLVSFAPNTQRREIFKDIKFVFASEKQMKRMGQAVRIAGGHVEPLSDGILKHLGSNHYLLVKPDSMNNLSVPKHLFSKAEDILQKKELRCIPESDIGLAILNVDKEKHCNPAFKISSLLPKGEGPDPSQLTENLIIFATETQDPSLTASVRSIPSTTTVPESGQSTGSSSGSLKKQGPISMAPPPTPSSTSVKPTLPKSMDVDEERIQKLSSTRKRGRGRGSETDSPSTKRKMVSSEVEETQTIKSQEDEDSAVDETDGNISSFRPAVVSTQTDIQDKDKMDEANMDRKQTVKKYTSAELETVDRSIPFEPFTLPSLKCDFPEETVEESGTLATQNYVKQEPLSQSEEQRREMTEEHTHMKGRREINKNQKSNGKRNDVLERKRAREDDGSDTGVGQNKMIKQECDDVELFALQDVGPRRRASSNLHKADDSAGSKRGKNSAVSNEELFSLDSSHAVRRRNRISSSASVDVEKTVSTVQSTGNTYEPQTNPQEIQPLPSRKPESAPIQSTGFISTGNPIHPKTSSSSTSEETMLPDAAGNEVEDLTHQMDKSLVVVEVLSLYRRNSKNSMNSGSGSTNGYKNTYGGLTNFKRFRKSQHGSNSTEVLILPRIIGSGDLLSHDCINSKRDDFFDRNAEVSRFLEERETENQASSNAFSDEALFSIKSRPRARNRVT